MLHLLALLNNIFLKDICLLFSIPLCRVVLRTTSNKILSCLLLTNLIFQIKQDWFCMLRYFKITEQVKEIQ